MRFQCPYCKIILDIDGQPGEKVKCGKCGNDVNIPLSKTAPGAIIGTYVILREIGTGGMGTVFLAHQINLDRDVALKILLPEFEADKRFLKDFINEARMAAQIRHPNVVEAYDVGLDTASGMHYFAMEFVDGLTLKQQVETTGPLPEEKVLEIATTMIDALSYGWNEKKLIHRDIKPDNIIMNSLGQAKLADLGLAKKVNEIAEDGSSELYGTPQCIAPELVFGAPATPSSDIYALGATLYFLLTGQFPYTSQDIETIVTMHLETPLPSIGDPAAPAPLETLIRIMMAKRPCHRYQNYDELKADLELVKKGQQPSHENSPAAQVPIDSNSADPMQPIEVTDAIPMLVPVAGAGGGKRIAFKGNKPKTTLNANAPAAPNIATGEGALPEASLPLQKPSSGKGKLIAIVAVIIILLAGGGAFFALKGGNKAGGPTSPTDGKAAKKVNTVQLDKLLADGSDEKALIDEITRIIPEFQPDQPETADFNAKVAPYIEKVLAQSRQTKYDEFKGAWDRQVEDMKEQTEKEKREAEQKAAEEKAAEEKKAAEAAAEKAKKAAEAAFAQKQADFRTKLLEYANKHDFDHPVIMLSEMEASEDEKVTQWAKSWHDRIEMAEKFYKMFRIDEKRFAGATIRVLRNTYKKNPQGQLDLWEKWEIESISFSSISITQKRTVTDKKGKESIVSIHDKLNLDTLLPHQMNDLANAAVEKKLCEQDEAMQMLATYMLIRGAYLKHAKEQLVKYGDTFGAEEADSLNGTEYLKAMIKTIPKLKPIQVNLLCNYLKLCDPNAFENLQEQIEELKKTKKK